MLRQRFKDAEAYRSSSDRRHAIFHRLLRELPEGGDLVIIAHSLGSVVAADLIYYLPEQFRLRMLVTLGSPLALSPLRDHLNRRRHRFAFEILGPWINLAGTGDLVTGFRGISSHFPEALDVFVDTHELQPGGRLSGSGTSSVTPLPSPTPAACGRPLIGSREVMADTSVRL